MTKTKQLLARIDLLVPVEMKLLAEDFKKRENITYSEMFLHGFQDLIKARGSDEDLEALMLLERQEHENKIRSIDDGLASIRHNQKIKEKIIEPQNKEKALMYLRWEKDDPEHEVSRLKQLARRDNWKKWKDTEEIPFSIIKEGNFKSRAHALKWLQEHDPEKGKVSACSV